MNDLNISLEELYTIIGELEVVRRIQTRQIKQLEKELEELSRTNNRLREANGKLGKSDSHE